MKMLNVVALASVLLAVTAAADVKILSNEVLKDKGYERLEGTSDFRLGCRYIIRSEDRTIIYRPVALSGIALMFTLGDIFYAVYPNDKSKLFSSDGGVQAVTTWRTCAVL